MSSLAIRGIRGRTLASQILSPNRVLGRLPLSQQLRVQQARWLNASVHRPVVSVTAGSLNIAFDEGQQHVKRDTLPSIWLRDNCRCSKCVNQATMQRAFNTFDIPEDVHPVNVESQSEGLQVKWSDGEHESFYPWDFIVSYLSADRIEPEPVDIEYFGAQGPANARSWPPSIQAGEIATDEDKAIGKLTDLIRRYGFAFVSGVPSESGEDTEKLLKKIAFIRQTHYGGFYDFIPDLAMADTAYTNQALSAHTDTTYFSDPAGLQAFHLLSHSEAAAEGSEGAGGRTLLVDGFQAADILREEEPRAYDILSHVKLPWHASGNEGVTIAPALFYPVFEVNPRTGMLYRVRWNNDDRGVIPFDREYSPTEWYDAARKWDSILRRKSMEYWVQLTPGNLLIFDNWRVLHGRSAFTGVRRMCGGYINRDDFISRWRNTNYTREEILRRIIG